jgi:hypothetical protein
MLTTSPRGERVLVVDMTMTDPVFYMRPVTGQKKWVEVPNGHLLPYDRNEEGWQGASSSSRRAQRPGLKRRTICLRGESQRAARHAARVRILLGTHSSLKNPDRSENSRDRRPSMPCRRRPVDQ